MSVWKSGLVAVGLLTGGLGAAVVLGDTAPGANAPGQVAEAQQEAKQPDGGVRVEAPSTEVNVDKEGGKVSVRAPYTDVRVDPDKGQVQVRAPYVDLDIRW